MNKFDFKKIPGRKDNNVKVKYDGKPLISIITPYYNAEKYINATAKSVFNQTFPYFEWIIVNDGSTSKETEKVLKKLEASDDRITVLSKKNGGPAAARRFGAKHAKSDILFVLDADDLIDNTMLECGYFTLLTNPKAVWAYTPIVNFGDKEFLYNVIYTTKLEKKENIITGNCFIRKDKFLEVTEYDKLPKEVHEDWYMWLTFLSKKYVPIKMNFFGFWYRKLESGRLNTINASVAKTKIADAYLDKVKTKIKTNVKAIQFPVGCEYEEYTTYPKTLTIGKDRLIVDNENKRILFILPWAIRGGADLFNLNLIKNLYEKNYRITVITTESHEYDLRQDIEEYVDEFFDLSTFLRREDFAGFISYIMYTRNINMVFQSNCYYGYYAIPWLKANYPDVVFVDYLHAHDWSWRDGGYPRDSIAISHLLDRTYTCTNYLKDLMKNEMNKTLDNTKVSYIGADTEHFDPKIKFDDEEALRAKYKGKKIVLFPCRIVHLKRPVFMAEIMKEIAKKYDNYICLFVGSGEALELTKEFVTKHKLENVTEFIPMKKDLRVYYKIADVTIVCSLTEGLTLTAYESLAMGTPVVSSDVGGQKELITDDCGRIIKTYQTVEKDLFNYHYSKKEIKEYVDAIIDITTSKDYPKYRKASRKKLVDSFCQTECIESLAKDLESLIIKGTSIPKEMSANIEMAERYLILHNECNRIVFDKSYEKDFTDFKKQLGNKFWKYKAYRGAIKFAKIILMKRDDKSEE